MRLLRALLVTLGVTAGAYGGWLLVHEQAEEQWRDALVWLMAGVVLHDALLSGVLLVVVALGARLLPRSFAAPAAVALVVLGSVTLMAVPVLGRFGALPDNPTLLDRPYVAGWLLLAGMTVTTMLVTGAVRARRRGAFLRAGEGPGRQEHG